METAFRAISAAAIVSWGLALSACSGSADPPKDDGSHAAEPAPDAGGGGATKDDAATGSDAHAMDGGGGAYPAFKPDIGLLVNKGGPVLTAPKVVSIVWTADPNYKTYEKLSDDIGASAYWKTAVSEYGVGPATSGGHVEIAEPPPASFDVAPANDEIDQFVKDGVTGAPGNGWPLPDAQTIYLVYIPESVALLNNGKDDCANNVGYHTETNVGAYSHVVYGIVAEKCHDLLPVLDNTTETATHEIGEAATDPHTDTDLAWTGFDTDHYAWELWQQRQDENGDACEFFEDSYYKDAELGVFVQRLWSNKAAAAGTNPCLPAPDEAYFSATTLAQETITPTGTTGKTRTTKGFHIPVGETKTFDIGFYSDRATDDWTVTPSEGDGTATPTTKHLEVSIDTRTGNNGTKAKVTVKVLSLPTKGNQILLTLVSGRTTGPKRYFPILVGAYK